MNSFEERLYNHWMYTNALSNMIYDMEFDIRDNLGENSVSLVDYDKGKYATMIVNEGYSIDAVISHIEYVKDIDGNYYEDLKFLKNGDRELLFYIEI